MSRIERSRMAVAQRGKKRCIEMRRWKMGSLEQVYGPVVQGLLLQKKS